MTTDNDIFAYQSRVHRYPDVSEYRADVEAMKNMYSRVVQRRATYLELDEIIRKPKSVASQIQKSLSEKEKARGQTKENVKQLKQNLKVLQRATQVKFEGDNHGVLVAGHRKPRKFVYPIKQDKFEVADQLWGFLASR